MDRRTTEKDPHIMMSSVDRVKQSQWVITLTQTEICNSRLPAEIIWDTFKLLVFKVIWGRSCAWNLCSIDDFIELIQLELVMNSYLPLMVDSCLQAECQGSWTLFVCMCGCVCLCVLFPFFSFFFTFLLFFSNF